MYQTVRYRVVQTNRIIKIVILAVRDERAHRSSQRRRATLMLTRLPAQSMSIGIANLAIEDHARDGSD